MVGQPISIDSYGTLNDQPGAASMSSETSWNSNTRHCTHLQFTRTSVYSRLALLGLVPPILIPVLSSTLTTSRLTSPPSFPPRAWENASAP